MLNGSFEKIKNISILTQIYDHWKLIAFIVITSGYFIYYNYLSLMGVPFMDINVPLITAIGIVSIVNIGFILLFAFILKFDEIFLVRRYSFLIIYILLIGNFDTSYNSFATNMFPLAIVCCLVLISREEILLLRDKSKILYFAYAIFYAFIFVITLLLVSIYYFLFFLLICLLHIIYLIIFSFSKKNTKDKKESLFFFAIIAISISFSSIIYKQGLSSYILNSKNYTQDLIYQDARHLYVLDTDNSGILQINKTQVSGLIKYEKRDKPETVYKFLVNNYLCLKNKINNK